MEEILRNPTAFLTKCSEKDTNRLIGSLKEAYDHVKAFESQSGLKPIPKNSKTTTNLPLSSLLVDGFDAEQIWQQIELQNNEFRRNFKMSTDKASTSQSVVEDVIDEDEGEDDDEAIEMGNDDEEFDIEKDEEEMEDDEVDGSDGKDDEEMEDDDDDDDIDGEEEEDYESGEDYGEDNEEKTAFEQQQEKLNKRISEFEEQIVSEKPWQLHGEVTANRRPENSLLEEHLFYDHATKLPPVITQETTESLESLIIRRIRDQAWDDVERKVKPVNTPYVYKNELVLDQEKSKMSLSQVYEQEYLKKNSLIEEEKKNPKHEEIRKAMKDLFFKLDLLTAYHYTPKPIMPELKVVNNMPSIRMEEVAPVSISDAAMLAPEEIKEKRPGDMKAKEERNRVDKNRDLRKKKKKQKTRAERRQKSESTKTPRDKMKLLRKVGKIRRVPGEQAQDKTKGTTSSKDFFSRLQTQVKNSISTENIPKIRKGEKTKKTGSAFKT